MKRIYHLQAVPKEYCLKSYKGYLNILYTNAIEGKDPNCNKCDADGFLKTKNFLELAGKKFSIPTICDCVKDEKSKIFRKIEEIDMMMKRYNDIFGTIDNDITLDIFENKFNQKELIESIKKYLDLGSSLSLYLTGESGVGKTTILKLLWQIYTMNGISVFYLKASHFEDLYKNLFNKNANNENIKNSIDKKIENAKKVDILLIDDIDSIGFSYATDGYYKIFDNIRTQEKTVIIASNKNYNSLLNRLNNSSKRQEASFISGRITSRLLNLKIVEVEMHKSKVKVDAKNKELVLS
ncbi:ATP-binding protein [Brachyspira pilosicoli]|uniref:ATP-binding protein n=1 Tax=Brachyspira pilosicoli TaxID=52584 RepID=UPI0026653C2D|nr:ATP-binding protein [Brachyspira pilosicoli]